MTQIFDNLYWTRIQGRYKLGYSTVDNTAVILWTTLQTHELMAELSKHEIKRHPSITSIVVRFIVTSKISEPHQEISQMKMIIKVSSTKSYRHQVRLTNIEE